MAIDIQQYFNQDIITKLAENPDAAQELSGTYQFNISGSGGGEWYLTIAASGSHSEFGHPGTASNTITMATEDFQKIMNNPRANLMAIFFAGKLKTSGGNPQLPMNLMKLFAL